MKEEIMKKWLLYSIALCASCIMADSHCPYERGTNEYCKCKINYTCFVSGSNAGSDTDKDIHDYCKDYIENGQLKKDFVMSPNAEDPSNNSLYRSADHCSGGNTNSCSNFCAAIEKVK